MNITFKSAVPHPLAEVKHGPDSVWGNEVELIKGRNYLINAPSGKGKTTFLNIIYGIRKDFNGQVFLNGENTQSLSHRQWSSLRKNKLSMVFQDLRLFANLTALQNIELKIALSGVGSIPSVSEMAKRLGIETLLNKPCKKLSYGQQQRIAIVRALQQPFDWLLLDEPFSHLDAENIAIASALISEVCQKKNAGMLVTTLGSDYPFAIHQTLNI